MNADQFTRQAQDMFNAAKEARIPENVQAIAEEGVAKTREAYSKISAVAKDNAKAWRKAPSLPRPAPSRSARRSCTTRP